MDKQKLHILQHQIDPSGNFVSYRATLKAAQWRAEAAKSADEKVILISYLMAHYPSGKICVLKFLQKLYNDFQTIIPFFVLLLKDLYLIYHGSMRVLPNGHLNFVVST